MFASANLAHSHAFPTQTSLPTHSLVRKCLGFGGSRETGLFTSAACANNYR